MASIRAFNLPLVPMGVEIPKKIHQIYTKGELPEAFSVAVQTLRSQNPNWIYRLYSQPDITSYILNHYGKEILDLYQSINPQYGAAQADLFRYLLLYREGGVYLDIKSGSSKPLGEVIRPDDRFIVSGWDRTLPGQGHFGLHPEIIELNSPVGEIQQWHIITVAGHPFLRAVINHVLSEIAGYSPWRHGVGRKGTYRVTGPIAYSRAITPLLTHHPHRLTFDTAEGLIYLAAEGSHRRFFKGHYLVRTDPVVTQRGAKRVMGWVYDGTQRVVRDARRGIRLFRRMTGQL